jgi:hypothetical protein
MMSKQHFRIKSILVFVSLSLGWVHALAKTQVIDSFESSEAAEAKIKASIVENLELFLSKEDFRVFATASVKKYREKIVLDGQQVSKVTGKEKKLTGSQDLPGFSAVVSKEPTSQDVGRKETSRFAYRNRTKLTKASVKLVLDKSLERPLKELATKTSKDALNLVVGSVGVFESVELNLRTPGGSAGVWEWFSSHLSRKGGDAIDLLYLSVLCLSFLGALLTLLFYFRSKRISKNSLSTDIQSSDFGAQKKIDQICGKKLDTLISLLNSSPLITRNFLQNLSDEHKNFLYQSLRTPALRGVFVKVLKMNQPQTPERGRLDPSEVFETIINDLKRYILLNNVMESKPFGYLSVLTGSQVAQFIAGESDRALAMGVVAPYLASHQISEVTKMMSIAEKSVFLGAMRDKNGEFVQSGSEQSNDFSELKSEVETRLRQAYLKIRDQAVVDLAEASQVEESFLESDVQAVDVIKRLAAEHGKLPQIYEKYLVGFEDFLGLDLGIGRRVMSRISNEVLVLALRDTKIDARVVQMLGDVRTQLIKSLMKREAKVGQKDVAGAQNQVLREYRASV